MAELLLEILSEEIPARMQTRAADDLKRLVCDGLQKSGLAFTGASAYATPRRLALVAVATLSTGSNLSAWQDDPAAINLHSTGVRAFDQGEYDLAIDQWTKLLDEYPDYSARFDVRYCSDA